MEMSKTRQTLITIGAFEQQREAIEQKLKEVKAELDDLDARKRGADVEFSRLKKRGLWGRLFTSFR
jgi:hypothetical protein